MVTNLNKIFFTGLRPATSATSVNLFPNPTQSFRGEELRADSFEIKSIENYAKEPMITKLTQNNPNINRNLAQNSLPAKLKIGGLNDVLRGHADETRKLVVGVAQNLPFKLYAYTDIQALKDAAYLHDIGKVFIPKEILNKQGKLSDAERKIIHTHSELGYELLRKTSLNDKTLHLIRNHHQNALKTGYPNVHKDFFADLNLQILAISDKYSALTEQRAYKPAMSREKALSIIQDDVKQGLINPIVYNALVKYTAKISQNA